MSIQATYLAALNEVFRIVVEGAPPNGSAPDTFGIYAPVVRALHDAYNDAAGDAATIGALLDRDTLGAVRREWDIWRRRPEYRMLAGSIQEAAAGPPDNQGDLAWLYAQLSLIPRDEQPTTLRPLLQPTIDRIVAIDDDPTMVSALESLREYFKWGADTFRAYKTLITRERNKRIKDARAEIADAPAEDEQIGPTTLPPIYISPALSFHNGVVYIAHKVASISTRHDRRYGDVRSTIYRPEIITSTRGRIVPKPPRDGADPDSIWWLDEGRRLALPGPLSDAVEGRWSYDSMVAWLNGAETPVTPHGVFDALMASLRAHVHHDDEESYIVDALWAMGTYFYRMFPAYPYLALHGEKGSGKTTLLNWLADVCFNAEFVVNTSEASLFRTVQAKSPTLLIDEQEGLNTSRDAKQKYPDLMGILKSGYKLGAKVMRQRTDRPEITEYFDVYSPKALAAIELFETVLANRTIPTFMHPRPEDTTQDTTDDTPGTTVAHYCALRDMLYTLVMTHHDRVQTILQDVRVNRANRYRELLIPLYVMADLIDQSRNDGLTTIREAMDRAAARKAEDRKQRDLLTTEATLHETLTQLCSEANDDANDFDHGTIQKDGWVLVDTIQIKHAFERMFSSERQSFYNDIWLGRMVLKMRGAQPAKPRRRRRTIASEATFDGTTFKPEVKWASCYLLDPIAFCDDDDDDDDDLLTPVYAQ